jgi:PAS domain S-box-containing protein
MSSTPRSPAGNSAHRKTLPTNPAPHQQTEFESFAETTSAAIFITQGYGILYANSAAIKSTGYTREELLGMELWQIAHPNYELALKQLGGTHAWVEHIPSRYEIKIVTKAGEENWLDVTIGDIDYKGEPAIAVTAFDITERDRAERALRKTQAELEVRVQERTAELAAANERLQSVLGTITEAYMAFDSDWRFLTLNEVSETKIFGRPAKELIGKVIWDEYPQTVGQEVYRQYHLAVETRQPVHFETPSRIVPGRWFEVHAYPRADRLEVFSRDITERKRAEEERTRLLAEVEKRVAELEATISSMATGLIVYNTAGKAIRMNHVAKELLPQDIFFNLTVEERARVMRWETEAGQPFPPEEIPVARALHGETSHNVVLAAVFSDHKLWISASAAPILTLDGQQLGVVASFVDITEQKRVEAALHKSEERFRIALQNSPITVATLDRDLHYTWVYNTRHGFDPAQVLGKRPDELIGPDEARDLTGLLQRALETSTTQRNEVSGHTRGERWVYDVTAEPLLDTAGKVIGLTIVNIDITERKRVEEALYQSEEKYRRLIENIDDLVCEVDAQTRYQFVNAQYEQVLGYAPEELLGHAVRELIHPDDLKQSTPSFRKLIDGGSVSRNEWRFRHKNGAWRWFDCVAQTYEKSPGQQHVVVISRDVTERRRMEEALRQARDELEIRVQERTQELAQSNEELRLQMAAVRAAANGIVITDRQGSIQWCNPAFTDMTGYAAEEVLGKNLRLLSSGQQSPDFYRRMWATILAGDAWRGELTNRRKDGRLYVEEQTIAPVLNDRQEIAHFIAVKRDITERKQAEERLARYNQDLLALSKAERDQRQLAETLTAANLALTQSLNLETVLETLLDYVARLVPYDSANVMLLESESRLVVRVTRGYERWSNAELVRTITFDAPASPMLNELLTTRRSCLVPDTHLEPGWQTPPGVEHVRSWLGVPLMAGGNVIGIYSLDKTEPGFFTAEHVRMAEMLVGQAAVAIQNAWLFEQVRAGRERLQSLSRRLVEVQEAERHYVARELHDEAGQALTSLLFGLGQLEQQLNDPRQADHVTELKHMTNEILESLHRLAMDLRPASLDHLGLVPALVQYVKALGDRYGLIAQFKTMGFAGERLSSEVETALYRIVQEALTNVVRHAQATRADVLLERRGDHVVVVIEDNGQGFDAEIAHFAQQGHLGLVGMQERAEMLGGSLVIESTAGSGTTVVVEVPNDHTHLDR